MKSVNYIYTSGLKDALNIDQKDRRYKVMSHALCPVCEFSYSGGHFPDCPWAPSGEMGHVSGLSQPGGFSNAVLRESYLKVKEERAAAERRQEEIRREYGQNARQVTPYKPNRAQRRAQAAAQRAQARKNQPKRSK